MSTIATRRAARPDRRSMIAKVHVAKKQLSLTEDDYRALLARVTGAASLSAATDLQIAAVLKELERLGWKPKPRAKPAAQPHHRKVFALWGALQRAGGLRDGSAAALRSFVLRQTGVGAVEWLTAAQCNSVTEALKAMVARAQSGAPAEG